ncbi:hypothetical protein NEIMUCOT_04159 [Neisseria mucosa ATCC 25996]|uniref:Uncharacterized protein n=1 Tax=Neisseria mucosa (strain ATCC 25996 / DSM 4631 / NCTC 10774 / M26) TaxID=546266 RepID=D2ZU71_NEIM2|nr:hypothetical protein NEIMUCOT_04159 [Neisseria mucosa ATCC 25996]
MISAFHFLSNKPDSRKKGRLKSFRRPFSITYGFRRVIFAY